MKHSHSKKHSKKADLSLSTNAIVILILAITILGLGLTFVRGLFKQAETKVAETFSATELANPPTRDNPVTIAPGLLTLREGKSGKAVIAHYNPKAGNMFCRLAGGTGTGTGGASILMSSEEATIPRDGTNTWVVAVSAGTGVGTKLFSFGIDCCRDSQASAVCATGVDHAVYSKDLVVKVET